MSIRYLLTVVAYVAISVWLLRHSVALGVVALSLVPTVAFLPNFARIAIQSRVVMICVCLVMILPVYVASAGPAFAIALVYGPPREEMLGSTLVFGLYRPVVWFFSLVNDRYMFHGVFYVAEWMRIFQGSWNFHDWSMVHHEQGTLQDRLQVLRGN